MTMFDFTTMKYATDPFEFDSYEDARRKAFELYGPGEIALHGHGAESYAPNATYQVSDDEWITVVWNSGQGCLYKSKMQY